MESPKRPESATQFDDIFQKHHSEEEKEKRKIIKKRQLRGELKKKDLGY